jgi:hypothetical protein
MIMVSSVTVAIVCSVAHYCESVRTMWGRPVSGKHMASDYKHTHTMFSTGYWQYPGLCVPPSAVPHLFRGWVFSYRTSDLSLGGAWTPLPGCEAGIWQAGAGVAVDTTGDGSVYVAMGNGLVPDPVSGGGYGNAVMRLSSGDLRVLDYFVPYNTVGEWMVTRVTMHACTLVLESTRWHDVKQ